MNWLFRRHFWIVHLMLLCIVAVVAAKTVSTLGGYWIAKSIPKPPQTRLFEEELQEDTLKNFALANERNLFAARREQISFADLEEINDTDPGRWEDAGPTSLPLKLISTMVFWNPFESRAVIQVTTGGSALVYSIADCEQYKKSYNKSEIETVLPEQKWEPERPCSNILGMATVKRIEEFRVYIFNERDRKYEFLSLLPNDVTPRQRVEAEVEASESGGIRKVGSTSYEIDQSEFDKALSNIARLLTDAKAIPEMDANGNLIGFKIIYIKEDSLFEKIGIERMDILTRINGYELNSSEKALQLFGKLRSANQFTIDIKRGDRSVTLDYSVVR